MPTFRDNIGPTFKSQGSWTPWSLKTGPIGYFEMSLTTNIRRLTSQNNEALYMVAKDFNYACRFLSFEGFYWLRCDLYFKPNLLLCFSMLTAFVSPLYLVTMLLISMPWFYSICLRSVWEFSFKYRVSFFLRRWLHNVRRIPGWSRPVILIKKVIRTEDGGQLWYDTVALCEYFLDVSKEHCCENVKGHFIGLLLPERCRATCQIHASATLPWMRELHCDSFAGPKPSRSQWHHAIWQMGTVQPVANGISEIMETCL